MESRASGAGRRTRGSIGRWALVAACGVLVALLLTTPVGGRLTAGNTASAAPASANLQGTIVASNPTCHGSSCVSLNRTSGAVGIPVSIVGTGFPGTSVQLSFVFYPTTKLNLVTGSPYPYNPPTTVTLASSDFSVSGVRLPLVSPGSYRFDVYDASLTGSKSILVDYKVTKSTVAFAVSPTSVAAGGCVLLTGSGFYPGDGENFYIGPASGSPGFHTLTGFSDTLTGTINYIWNVPTTYGSAKPYGLVVVGDTYGIGASEVTIATTGQDVCATVSPTQNPVGATYQVSGTGFTPSSLAIVTFGTLGGQTPTVCSDGSPNTGSIVTDASGDFVCTFLVPSVAAGPYTVQAEDVTTSTYGPAWTFEVTTPKVSVSPTRGPLKSVTDVSGTGFTVSSTVTLTFDSVSISAASCLYGSGLTTSATGTMNCFLAVPSHTSGTKVSVTDVTTGAVATTTFTKTTPKITVMPGNGVVGSPVTVAGTGFTEDSTLTSLVFDGVTITSCTTGSLSTPYGSGSWSCSFSVPSGTSGTSVVATDQYGATAKSTYTVT